MTRNPSLHAGDLRLDPSLIRVVSIWHYALSMQRATVKYVSDISIVRRITSRYPCPRRTLGLRKTVK